MPTITLKEIADGMSRAAKEAMVTDRRGLQRACMLIKREAKKKIGVYQAQAGEFDEWALLKDATKADRVRQGFSEDEPLLRTGELRKSIRYRTTPFEGVVGSTSQIMVYQELGTATIPKRPVLGAAAYEHKDRVLSIVAGTIMEGIMGKKSINQSKYNITGVDKDE